MAQFKKFTGLRTYTVPLQRDLRELERYLHDVEARLALVTEGESISTTTTITTLKKHATTHADGGTTDALVGTDRIGPYSFNWEHEHLFVPGAGNRTPITIRRNAEQVDDLISVQKADSTELMDMLSDGITSWGNPTNKNATINLKPLLTSTGAAGLPPDQVGSTSPLNWLDPDDVTGINDEPLSGTWNNRGTGNDPVGSADAFQACDWFSGAGANGLNGHNTVGIDTVGGANYGNITDIGSGACTVAVVHRCANTAGNLSFVVGSLAASLTTGFEFPRKTATATASYWASGTQTVLSTTFDNSTGLAGSDHWHITILRRAGSNNWDVYHDGVDRTPGTPANTGASLQTTPLFKNRSGTAFASNSGTRLAYLVMWRERLDDTDRGELYNWLFSRFFQTPSHLMQWELSGVATVDGRLDSSGRLGVGENTPVNRLSVKDTTTPQARIAYDASNHLTISVASSGDTTLALANAADILNINNITTFATHARLGDNDQLQFGDTQDATITYDNVNLVINPDAVGTGEVRVTGKTRLANESTITTLTPNADADALVIDIGTGLANANGISFLGTGLSNRQVIAFGDTADNDVGKIEYRHANNQMAFFANAVEVFRFVSTGAQTTDNTGWNFGFTTLGFALQHDSVSSTMQFNHFNYPVNQRLGVGSTLVPPVVVHFFDDDLKLAFGNAKDATIWYDNTNLNIDPDAVGSGNLVLGGNLDISTKNIITDTTTGTKIGTSTTQKLGFFNKTPVVQPSAYTTGTTDTDRSYDASATTVDELADVLGTLIADLQSLGLVG